MKAQKIIVMLVAITVFAVLTALLPQAMQCISAVAVGYVIGDLCEKWIA